MSINENDTKVQLPYTRKHSNLHNISETIYNQQSKQKSDRIEYDLARLSTSNVAAVSRHTTTLAECR